MPICCALLYHLRMPLLSFWKSNRDEVLKMTVEQVVSNAGDGHLRDGSEELQRNSVAIAASVQANRCSTMQGIA